MKLGTSLMAVTLLVACKVASQTATLAPAKDTGALATATKLDNIDLNDNVEDPTYVSAGEAIAKQTADNVLGQPAPLATMTTIDGETIDLGKTYGHKPVYIKFWATWCVPCRQQMPGFEHLFETVGDKIQVIALNIGLSDDHASVRAFREKYGLKMPIVMDDGHFASLFHLSVTPQHVIIGKDIRFAFVGHAENQGLANAVAAVIADTSTASPATAITPTTSAKLRVGDSVDLTATTSAGAKLHIGGARPGKLQAVVFFSSWCEWYLEKTRPLTSQACANTRQQIESLATLDANVDWIGIAGGPWATEQDLSDYQKNNHVTMPLALDKNGELFRTFGVRDIPMVVLVDSSGKVATIMAPGAKDIAATIRKLTSK
jgi:peroxiredoxin